MQSLHGCPAEVCHNIKAKIVTFGVSCCMQCAESCPSQVTSLYLQHSACLTQHRFKNTCLFGLKTLNEERKGTQIKFQIFTVRRWNFLLWESPVFLKLSDSPLMWWRKEARRFDRQRGWPDTWRGTEVDVGERCLCLRTQWDGFILLPTAGSQCSINLSRALCCIWLEGSRKPVDVQHEPETWLRDEMNRELEFMFVEVSL